MTKIAVCPKCKKQNIKVIKPEEEITYICEDCGFRKKLGNTEMAKILFKVYDIYIQSLSYAFVRQTREIPINEIKRFVLESFVEIMEQEQRSGK